MGEAALEGLALGDVPHRQHDAAGARIGEQAAAQRLDVKPHPVAVKDPPVAAGAVLDGRPTHASAGAVVGMDQFAERPADQRIP